MLKVLQIAQTEVGNVWSHADNPQGCNKFLGLIEHDR